MNSVLDGILLTIVIYQCQTHLVVTTICIIVASTRARTELPISEIPVKSRNTTGFVVGRSGIEMHGGQRSFARLTKFKTGYRSLFFTVEEGDDFFWLQCSRIESKIVHKTCPLAAEGMIEVTTSRVRVAADDHPLIIHDGIRLDRFRGFAGLPTTEEPSRYPMIAWVVWSTTLAKLCQGPSSNRGMEFTWL